MSSSRPESELQEAAARLMVEVDAIRVLETRRRAAGVGSDEFDRLAGEIERKARGIFLLAQDQRDIGEDGGSSEEPVDDGDGS